MKALEIPRKYLTASELMERWGLRTDLDLRRLVMEGVLKLCVMREEELTPVSLSDGELAIRGEAEVVRAWLYPQFPIQFLPFDCLYRAVCDMADPVEGACLWTLPQPLTISALMEEGVAMLDDVLIAEAVLRRDPDRDLSVKEEKTRDRLITILAAAHLGWEPWEEGKDMQLAPLLEAADTYGLPISRGAAKSHLRLAWERAKPA